jgi:hypothetical protein
MQLLASLIVAKRRKLASLAPNEERPSLAAMRNE